VRGLKSTSMQLSMPVEEGAMACVWEGMPLLARERVLRLLACVIGRVVSGEVTEEDR